MRLLVVVNWYPPDLRVPARRWGNLVANLQQHGFDCTVVSAGDGRYAETVGEAGERVIRLPISNVDGDASARPSSAKWAARKRTLRQIAFAAVPPLMREFSARRWLSLPGQHPLLNELAAASDYVVSSYGPFGPFILGWWLARQGRKPWAVDIRDSIDFKDGLTLPPARFVSRRLERRILRDATLRITIGDTLAEYLSRLYALRFHAIYNGWSDSDVIPRNASAKAAHPYLYYAGSIYGHRLPAVDVVCKALRTRPTLRCKIRLLKDHTRGQLTKLIESSGVRDQIEVLPPAPQATVDEELASAHAALVLEDISGENELMNSIVTGKLLGLLVSGIPGIAVSARTGEIRRLVRDVPSWHGAASVSEFEDALSRIAQATPGVERAPALRRFHMAEQAAELGRLLRDSNARANGV